METAQLNGGGYGHGVDAVTTPSAVPAQEGGSPLRLLGLLLLREGLVTEDQLAAALREQEAGPAGRPLGQILVLQGSLSPAALDAALARYELSYRLGDVLVETSAISETQLQLAVDHHCRTGLGLDEALLQLGFVDEATLRGGRGPAEAAGDPPPASPAGAALVRQRERLGQARAALAREYQHAVRALSELRQAQEDLLHDQTELLRSSGEQAERQAEHDRRLAELQAAHVALRQEHEVRGQAHGELTRAHAAALDGLQAARAEQGRLEQDQREVERQLVEERERGAELARRLAELEAAHDVARRELDDRLRALTALDAAYAETTHALASLRAEHEFLRGEHERTARELQTRCESVEGRQEMAVQQLETLLARLRQ